MFQDKKSNLALLIAVSLVSMAIVGGVRGYSPVPFWDMWNGYLEFYLKVSAGDFSAWWAQHNEHRIVLARLFFWIDISFFKGAGWFLIIINYLLILIGWLFSWSQHENLTWGFQSQFILAQLLPLVSFYFLHKSSISPNNSLRYFFGALICGFLAIGTMANGIITLPLLTIFALLLRFSWQRIILLLTLSFFGIFVYFIGYDAPQGHGSLIQTLRENPIGMFEFILLYIGGPFYFLLNGGTLGIVAAKIFGLGLIIISAALLWKFVRQPKNSTLQMAMLFFIIYVGATAFATAGGRLSFGLEQALASRYMTPVLMAWASFAVLCKPFLHAGKRLVAVAAILMIMIFFQQTSSLKSQANTLFQRNLGALALELGVKDQSQIKNLWFSADATLAIVEKAREQKLSVFGIKPLIDLRETLDKATDHKENEIKTCNGYLDEIKEISEDDRFMKIRGWVYEEGESIAKNKVLKLIDGSGLTVGYALHGQRRDDVRGIFGDVARYSGYEGYVMANKDIIKINGCAKK
jgi:hypothetical protein